MELQAKTMGPFHTDVKKMFGSTCYFVNGQMVTGVHEDSVFLRLSEADREEFKVKYKGAVAFAPIKGRPMKEYIIVPPEMYKDDIAFNPWIKRSMEYARSLPPKPPKAKKK
ncbi:MAG TPA: TfoX/Sxy family protein [Methanocella sp.]|uniref:TfoX/Sxy family protein n=1 Tax=Methanocella sp. TaxID=2052833 RepID=UPI002CEC922C|nr:TfoX/Sxy family protein [Methanocella sp.]HTY92000.1 TfoX/Sxy family protein [Methanocella sp.]